MRFKAVRTMAMLAIVVAVALIASPALAVDPPPADGQRVGFGDGAANLYAPYEYPTGSGVWYAGGAVVNFSAAVYSDGVTVTDPQVTIEYVNSAYAHVAYERFSIGLDVLPAAPAPGNFYFFSHRLTVPAGADASKTRIATELPPTDPSYPARIYGTAARNAPLPTELLWVWGPVDTVALGEGRTLTKVSVTNSTSNIVGPVKLYATERFGPSSDYDALVITADDPAMAARLSPGATTTFTARGLRATGSAPSRDTPYSAACLAAPLVDTTVWRFYNAKKGTHFYTANEAEKNTVVATLSNTFRLEGVGYTIRSASAANAAPLHRFFNRKTGTHFYTVDPAEKTRVETTLASTYTYEGIAYYVSSSATTGATAVYRFFNKKNQTHFYTADPAEKARVQNTLSKQYQLDGVGFYLAR